MERQKIRGDKIGNITINIFKNILKSLKFGDIVQVFAE